MDMKRHIPNFITSLNLAIGCIGIFYVLTESRNEAIYFVMLAGFFDFLDGFAARLLKVKSEIGKQLDSLADMISFGLLPAFFLLVWMQESVPFYWVAIIIAVFSAIRLAKFNIDDTQADSFVGLPTPANAIMITSLIFLPFELYWYTLLSICLLSALLLVSPVRLLALKFSSFTWRGNEARWILIFGSLVLALVFQWTFLPFLIPFYLVVSIISYVLSRNSS